jgi:hypothetical protein
MIIESLCIEPAELAFCTRWPVKRHEEACKEGHGVPLPEGGG